jgi:hypothetical protein
MATVEQVYEMLSGRQAAREAAAATHAAASARVDYVPHPWASRPATFRANTGLAATARQELLRRRQRGGAEDGASGEDEVDSEAANRSHRARRAAQELLESHGRLSRSQRDERASLVARHLGVRENDMTVDDVMRLALHEHPGDRVVRTSAFDRSVDVRSDSSKMTLEDKWRARVAEECAQRSAEEKQRREEEARERERRAKEEARLQREREAAAAAQREREEAEEEARRKGAPVDVWDAVVRRAAPAAAERGGRVRDVTELWGGIHAPPAEARRSRHFEDAAAPAAEGGAARFDFAATASDPPLRDDGVRAPRASERSFERSGAGFGRTIRLRPPVNRSTFL